MKSLSNTAIAVIISTVLTLFIALLPQISFFQRWEDLTGDGLMSLSYNLHKKISPKPTDQGIVLGAIDERSLQMLGRWPFRRYIHAHFLGLLEDEKPRSVAWDIFFTEKSSTETAIPELQGADNQAPAAPDANSPAPSAEGVVPAPTSVPTNAVPSPAVPISPSTNTFFNPSLPFTIGAEEPAPTSAAPSTAASADSSQPAPAQDAAADKTGAASDLTVDDQALVQGVSLFPHLVTAAEISDSAPPLKDEELLPTRPLKNIRGDQSKLIESKSALIPFDELRKVSYFGFANEEGGTGGVRRRVPLLVKVGNQIFPSFDMQVLMQYWNIDPDKVIAVLGVEMVLPQPNGQECHIPIDEAGQMIINYRARLEDFQGRSYGSLIKGLEDKAGNQDSPERSQLPDFKDKLMMIGVTFNGTDAGVTPLDNNAPLVVTHLNTLNNILQHDFIRQLNPFLWLPVYAVFLYYIGNLMLRVGIAPMIPIGLLAMLFVAVVGLAALWFGNIQIPVAGPEFGLLVLASVIPTKRFFGEEREKRVIKAAMSASLSEKVMMHMLAHPDNVKLGGVKRTITVMFCDIRGFTKYCDNRDSAEVMDVLNDYMEEMTRVVFKYDGTVDKYIGDCIMAFWNAPDDQPDHAQRAVCCAMEMRYALAAFKTKRAGLDIELFECGIGIHTGEALVGQMGSSLKRSYTAMGSTVNMGARLEALTKRLNERILISEEVKSKLEGDFPLTDRGEATVPGFAVPVHVYAIGADQDISSALKVGRTLATKQDYTADEVTAPIWKPAPLPEDADPNP